MSFSHRDGYLTVTPIEGPNKGKPFRIKSGAKVAFDPGGKASYLKGFEQTPIAIVHGSAEPKLDVDVDSGREAWDVAQWVGGIGGNRFTVSHTFRRPGFRTRSFAFLGAELENGGGYDSDDSGVKSKLAIKLTDAHVDGVSVYARRYA